MQPLSRICCVLAIALSAALDAGVALAQAQNYPNKPVRMIIAFSPGGPTDVIARPIGQKLTEALGQPFVVDYKPGANAVIGADYVLHQPADGHTLLIFTSGYTINPSTQKSLPFDTLRDFQSVSPIARSDIILFVNPSLPVKNVKELIALAKSKPGKLNFASSGTGGSPHLAGELFKLLTNTDMTHVPYKGAGPATLDVVAGTADLAFLAAPPAVPLIKSGKLRLIGVASLKRAASVPDTPTIDEQGIPKFEVISFYGFSTSAAVPKPIVNKLNSAMQTILAMDDIRQAFNNSGLEPWYLKPDELQSWLGDEVTKWQKVTKAIKYVPE